MQELPSIILLFKGTVPKDFYSGFFHQTISPRALIHWLKPFRIWLRIRRENENNRLQSSDPAVSMSLRKSAFHRGTLRENDYWLSFPLKGNHYKKK
jgi:hypothetical protein